MQSQENKKSRVIEATPCGVLWGVWMSKEEGGGLLLENKKGEKGKKKKVVTLELLLECKVKPKNKRRFKDNADESKRRKE